MSRSNFALAVTALMLFGAVLPAQQLTATLNGTTYDQTGAVVPNAKVVVKNEASGDTRETVSNADGYFTVSALRPASYTVTISATGFNSWEQTGITLTRATLARFLISPFRSAKPRSRSK
jgi:hypothetical protein